MDGETVHHFPEQSFILHFQLSEGFLGLLAAGDLTFDDIQIAVAFCHLLEKGQYRTVLQHDADLLILPGEVTIQEREGEYRQDKAVQQRSPEYVHITGSAQESAGVKQ